MFKRLRSQSEVHISLLLGLFFVVLGVFILFNTGRIRGTTDGSPVNDESIETVLDLINAFFIVLTNMLSIIIGVLQFSACIRLSLFCVVMFSVGHTVSDTARYDGFLSFFFLALSLLIFVMSTVLVMEV